MKIFRAVTTVGVVMALTLGLTACFPGFTGSGVVTEKDIETSSTRSSTTKGRKPTISYRVKIDRPDSDMDMIVGVPKDDYESINIGDHLKFEKGQLIK